MKSFRTEIEDPIVERDILELEQKIHEFQRGETDEERFRTLRLARGVYGQRQLGVQMIRIKLPYGKLNAQQLRRIARVSDEYSNGNLHITTRQDIQIHHVSLDRTPELWAELEQDQITLREACGNTVRNVTASALSGVDPFEVFDVRPYAEVLFKHFLRNPICQEMGRKVKIAFSNGPTDTALTFMHDIGFIAKIVDGKRGFKVMIAGGLGSQSRQADVFSEFIPEERILTLTESILRIFERYGERANRMKARLKFLVRSIGAETFKELVLEEERNVPVYPVDIVSQSKINSLVSNETITLKEEDLLAFENWKSARIVHQKQSGLFAVKVRVKLGNLSSDQARSLAELIERFTGDEITLTIDQNFVIRHIPEAQLPRFFYALHKLEFSNGEIHEQLSVTSCPGTDTCNLGIANSTQLASVVEQLIRAQYPEYASSRALSIKISGCMNSCGQHMIASIGFQGMTIKAPDKRVLPAMQILLGGGNLGDGQGRFADKVIKIPTRRAPKALSLLLNEFRSSGESDFLSFYDQKGERYFYNLLKPLADLSEIKDEDFIDWGQEAFFQKSIGVGECAGVVIDLVGTLFAEAEEKLDLAAESIDASQFSDSIYHTYSALLSGAKAVLISLGKRTNSQMSIIEGFDEVHTDLIPGYGSFKDLALAYTRAQPTSAFAKEYIQTAVEFLASIQTKRTVEHELS